MNIKTLAITACAAVFSLSACGGTDKNLSSTPNAELAHVASTGTVERSLNLRNFTGITVNTSVIVNYTRGADYKVVVRGDKDALDRSEFFVSKNRLVVKQKDGSRVNTNIDFLNTLTLDITAPELNIIQNNGSTVFKAGQFAPKSLEVVNNGALSLDVDGISCNGQDVTVSISNNGQCAVETPSISASALSISNNGMLSIYKCNVVSGRTKVTNHGQMKLDGGIKGSSLTFTNSGLYGMDGTITLDGDFKYTNYGQSSCIGDISAGGITVANSGNDVLRGKFKAASLDMSIDGRSDYDVSYSGGQAKLDCCGVGRFKLALDCQSIDISTSGQIDIQLSGTADNTNFTGTGVSHIDTSRLNKF